MSCFGPSLTLLIMSKHLLPDGATQTKHVALIIIDLIYSTRSHGSRSTCRYTAHIWDEDIFMLL